MIDITPVAIAIIVVGIPAVLAYAWVSWEKLKTQPDTPKWLTQENAERAVRLVQDLRDNGYFDGIEKQGLAALDWAADWLRAELKTKGIDLDISECVQEVRIAYQNWKPGNK